MTRIPASTYRLQFRGGVGFREAASILPYLSSLGVTDLYASPLFLARPGSGHGYDVVDFSVIDPALGSDLDFAAFVEALRRHRMGLVLDVVPNHMSLDEANRWWWDLLENGPSSPYAASFDVDWAPPKEELSDKVLLPVLGDQYGRVLERGEIRLEFEDGAFTVRYFDRRFPVAPRTLSHLLDPALERLRARLGEEDARVLELESILTHLRNLPGSGETDPARVRERQREKEIARRRLADLAGGVAEVAAAVGETVAETNGRPGEPRSFVRLEALLADQAYRLSSWRVAADEINYRRFFDVNELAAVRVEAPEVFEAVHALVLHLVREGVATGLRIDHPDGLYDPEAYFRALQAAAREALGPAAPSPEAGAPDRPLWVVAEKILGRGERLRSSWAVHGTTGYDFLNLVNGLFVDPAADRRFREIFEGFRGPDRPFADHAVTAKKLILLVSLAGEIRMLARRIDRISEQHRHTRDFTFETLRFALREVVAAFPVYRSYVRAHEGAVGDEDRRSVETAIRNAKRRNPATDPSIFDFIRSVLLLDDPDDISDADRAARREFVMRFQQITGPAAAKGIEDTAFYRTFRLASLHEVGGDPERFGVTPAEFHRENAARLAAWPHAMISTATHDAKRGEDVRARLDVLSEIPDAWEAAIARWREMNRPRKAEADEIEAPGPNIEYLLYQTLVGVWPSSPPGEAERARLVERVERYMEKAAKEAKERTSWIKPNEAYDVAVRDFVRTVVGSEEFRADLEGFIGCVIAAGRWNALSQVVLKCAAPGVPDVYQGMEFWGDHLVDPDNRRPVDFEARRLSLVGLDAEALGDVPALVERLAAEPGNDRLKMWVTSRALRLRRDRRDVLDRGAYIPLEARGPRAGHAVAFARTSEDEASAAPPLIAAAGRFFTRLPWPLGRAPAGPEVWGGTDLLLPAGLAGVWCDALSGVEVRTRAEGGGAALPLDEVFARLPVALLVRASAADPGGESR